MSVEVVERLSNQVGRDVLTMSPEELRHEIDGIRRATTEAEARGHKRSYSNISKAFLDSHDEIVDGQCRDRREMILNELLNDPAQAFHGEFLQLKLLYSERLIKEDRWDGTQIDEFCTQNHTKHTCDYLFEQRILPTGQEIFEVRKVFMLLGKPDLMAITLKNDELRVTKQEYERGRTSYRELTGETKERVLMQFFDDTIHASALQIERSHDDRHENDQRARQYLNDVLKNDRILV